jgi:hypothetical protein
MKKLIASILLLSSVSALASSGDLIFTEGQDRGQIVDSSSFVGIYQTCYVGNPYAVKAKLNKWLSGDIEKDQTFVKVDTNKNRIIFVYVSTKCMDDSLDATAASCRETVVIPACE